MAEKPILFSGAMVRAVIKGSKTQTRSLIKPQPEPRGSLFAWGVNLSGLSSDANMRLHAPSYCPYGKPGDRLWVRETFKLGDHPHYPVWYRADKHLDVQGWPWKPAIHMFRKHSRLTLEITKVRVERVQDISRDDAIAEGMTCDQFPDLWEQINGKRGFGWEKNPWVWAISFKRVQP